MRTGLITVTLEIGLTRTIVERIKLHVQKRMNCLSEELWKEGASWAIYGTQIAKDYISTGLTVPGA